MSGKKEKPNSPIEDNFRLALGRVEKLRLMESLYKTSLREIEALKAKLATYEAAASGSCQAPSGVMRRSTSVTRELLNAAEAKKDLQHPNEFYEVMDIDMQEKIDILKKEEQNSKKDVEKMKQLRDELQRQIEHLMSVMTLKDEQMKELEHKYKTADKERCNCSEREEILRKLKLTKDPSSSSSSSSWENIEPKFDFVDESVEEEPETVVLRRKIEDLQHRVAELLHHNEKWNALCKELQDELDKVKGQLQQYQTAESSDHATLMADLKDQTEKKERAEKIALLAKKQIAELEQKVSDLERQLAEKEEQEREQKRKENERISVKVEEKIREQTELYEEQMKIYKEDFETEKRDHEITKSQLDSLKKQWQNIYSELQHKAEQLSIMEKKMDDMERKNRKLQEDIKQAHSDQCLIRDRANRFSFGFPLTEEPSSGSETKKSSEHFQSSEWTCYKCTFVNSAKFVKCEMCETARKSEEPPEVSLKLPSNIGARPPIVRGQLEEDGVGIKQMQWSCNECTYTNVGKTASCQMCARVRENQKFSHVKKKNP